MGHPPPAAPTDAAEAALLARLRSGDEAAFEQLVREQAGRMLAVARRLLRNDADAHDVVQEALLSAYRALGEFSGRSRLSTWLHRICVNAALMRLRRRGRQAEEPIEPLLPGFLEDGHQAAPAVDWRPDALAQMVGEERRQLVQAAIARLPERYRTVLLLRDIEELNTDETARALGISENAVKVRLHRARQALRGLLDPHFRGETSS